MLPEYDLVMFGLTRTDYTISSVSVAWAKEWSRTNRVFYIDRPFSIKDVLSDWKLPNFEHRKKAVLLGTQRYHTINYEKDSFVQVTPRMSLPLNFLPEGKLYQFLHAYNHHVVLDALRKTLRDYNVKNYVFFNSFHPVLVPYIPKHFPHQPLVSIYQSLDEISEEPYIARHGIAAEADAIRHCDLAIGTSTRLCERHEEASGRPVHLLANAADFHTFEGAHFRDLPMPEEMKNLPGPVILYTGHYSDLRLDHELVIRITREFPQASILFVGTYVEMDLKKEGLTGIPNLHFIGSRPIEQLPAFIRHSRVAIIPYQKNYLTSGIYPLKVNEYLAAGIPVVSTNFSKDIAGFNSVVAVANDHDAFIQEIKNAFTENALDRASQRMEWAFNNSWRTRITMLEGLMENYLNTSKG